MTGPGRAGDDADDVEALRRALYRRGAGPDEVAAYRSNGADAAEEHREASPGTRRTPRRAVILAAGAVATGATALAVATAVDRAFVRPRSPVPALLPLSADDRGEISHNLERGRPAGLRALLLSRPYPADIPPLGRLVALEFRGSGPRTVRLPALRVAERIERVTVLAVLRTEGDVEWRALRRGATVTTAARRQAAGAVSSRTFRIGRGEVPDRLRIITAASAAWGAAVVFSGSIGGPRPTTADPTTA